MVIAHSKAENWEEVGRKALLLQRSFEQQLLALRNLTEFLTPLLFVIHK